jgi:sugar phosphate isomerase/epimerase
MPGIISVREGCYGGWQNAMDLIPDLGITHMEIECRPADELRSMADTLAGKGISILTLSGGLNLDSTESMDFVASMCAVAGELSIPAYFLSTSGSELERAALMARLREVGERAAEHGVVLALETHPPFCRNADGMLETLAQVGHPNVRLNLDTANIFYYNHDLDSADELARVIDYVAALHIKETDGGFESENFGVLGTGVVKFPRIKQILDEAGFSGPLTMELEGPLVAGKSQDEVQRLVGQCMAYLRSVGLA